MKQKGSRQQQSKTKRRVQQSARTTVPTRPSSEKRKLSPSSKRMIAIASATTSGERTSPNNTSGVERILWRPNTEHQYEKARKGQKRSRRKPKAPREPLREDTKENDCGKALKKKLCHRNRNGLAQLSELRRLGSRLRRPVEQKWEGRHAIKTSLRSDRHALKGARVLSGLCRLFSVLGCLRGVFHNPAIHD